MPRFAANLSMMFTDVPFLDRFEAAAKAGFRGVEFLFPYDFPAGDIAERLKRHKLTQALFNLPPGDWAANRRNRTATQAEIMRNRAKTLLNYGRWHWISQRAARTGTGLAFCHAAWKSGGRGAILRQFVGGGWSG